MTEAALVIGYGNGLRSDDGAGPRVAELLASDDDVAVLVRHQLVPELADDLRGRKVVVFVDAATTLSPGAVATRRLLASTAAQAPGLTHHCDPDGLLLLAERLYGARPRAFLVTVGAAIVRPRRRPVAPGRRRPARGGRRRPPPARCAGVGACPRRSLRSPTSKVSTWPSSTPTAAFRADHPQKLICRGTSRSRRRACTRWCSPSNAPVSSGAHRVSPAALNS